MKPKNLVGIVLLGATLLVVSGATAFVVKAYRSPLGAALQVETPTPMSVNDEAASTLAATITPPAVCGESEVWNVLILGSDAGDMRGQKGSDLTRLLRVDFPNKKVSIYAFPRDLWVDTAGLGLTDPAVDAAKLGAVFYEARSRSTSTNVQDAMIDATNATARMLSKNFLVSTDHYVTLDLAQVPAMVDTVGGIPINIPNETTDPWIGMVIPAGQQTLNGVQFIAYARAIPDSDFGRIQRNNLLIAALREKLLDSASWEKIPQLYKQFRETTVTDLTPEQINHLSCLLKEVPSDAIVQEQVKQEWTSAGPQAGSLLWDRTAVLNQLRELGLIP